MSGTVVVIGSLSQDLVVKAPRRPARGETIRGTDFGMFVGGKGNNQALAAARAGASVAMVGRVGDDAFGTTIIDTLKKTGVDAQRVLRDPEAGSGIAMIIVGDDGDNCIVIAQQSNLKLSPADVADAKPLVEKAGIVLLQMEVPMETNIAAAKLARQCGVAVSLNPAPAPEDGKLPEELLQNLDFIVPNQTEATQITGVDCSDWRRAPEAAKALRALGPKTVIITLGEKGAFLDDGENQLFVDSFAVTAIDTTAAGDAFCGAFAAAYSRDIAAAQAVRVGCAAGALACTKLGAEPSLPQANEIEQLLQLSGASVK
jgi:ribokinase